MWLFTPTAPGTACRAAVGAFAQLLGGHAEPQRPGAGVLAVLGSMGRCRRISAPRFAQLRDHLRRLLSNGRTA